MTQPKPPAYTPKVELQCDGGTTHYVGCQCHEARRDAEVSSLQEEIRGWKESEASCSRQYHRLADRLAEATARAEKAEHEVLAREVGIGKTVVASEDFMRVEVERDQALARAEKAEAKVEHEAAGKRMWEYSRNQLLEERDQARSEAAVMRDALEILENRRKLAHSLGVESPQIAAFVEATGVQVDTALARKALASTPQSADWIKAWEEMEQAIQSVKDCKARSVCFDCQRDIDKTLARARAVRGGG